MRSVSFYPLFCSRGAGWLTRVLIFPVPLIVINTLVIVYELVLG